MKKVYIASLNPVKINATKNGFVLMFPEEEFEFIGVSVSSDVPGQPMGDMETLLGARNRVKNLKQEKEDGDFYVGLEGGVAEIEKEMASFAWMIVESSDGNQGKARTASLFLCEKVANLIREGKELGEADDIVFGQTNSKQKSGAAGLLTGGVIDRAGFYKEAIIFALIPFKNKELYDVGK